MPTSVRIEPLKYSVEIDVTLIFHLKLIGAALRTNQRKRNGYPVPILPEESEFDKAKWPDEPWWPLFRGHRLVKDYKSIQQNEPLTRAYENLAKYYQSWFLIRPEPPQADFDFDAPLLKTVWSAVGKRWIRPQTAQNVDHSKARTSAQDWEPSAIQNTPTERYILTSYGTQPAVVAQEILRSGRQAAEDFRFYYDSSQPNDVIVGKLYNLCDQNISREQTWNLSTHPRLTGLPKRHSNNSSKQGGNASSQSRRVDQATLEEWLMNHRVTDEPPEDSTQDPLTKEHREPSATFLEYYEGTSWPTSVHTRRRFPTPTDVVPLPRSPGRVSPTPATKGVTLARKDDKFRRPEDEALATSDWDSYGIQLRSPMKVVPNPNEGAKGFQDFRAMCSRLKGSKSAYHGAVSADQGCLKISVELPWRNEQKSSRTQHTMNMETLRHLMYIIVMYEDEIERIMPWDRRVTHSHNLAGPGYLVDIWSNKDSFVDTTKTRQKIEKLRLNPGPFGPYFHLDPTHPASSTIKRQAEALVHPVHVSLDQLKQTIFEADIVELLREFHDDRRVSAARDAELQFDDMTAEPWNNSVSMRGFIEVLTPGKTDPFAQNLYVVEFRQHESVMHEEMIAWWTLFCTGIVGLAQRRAATKVKWQDLEVVKFDTVSLFDLLEDMNFPKDGRDYFRQRLAFFEYQGSPSVQDTMQRQPPGPPTDNGTDPDDPHPRPRKRKGPQQPPKKIWPKPNVAPADWGKAAAATNVKDIGWVDKASWFKRRLPSQVVDTATYAQLSNDTLPLQCDLTDADLLADMYNTVSAPRDPEAVRISRSLKTARLGLDAKLDEEVHRHLRLMITPLVAAVNDVFEEGNPPPSNEQLAIILVGCLFAAAIPPLYGPVPNPILHALPKKSHAEWEGIATTASIVLQPLRSLDVKTSQSQVHINWLAMCGQLADFARRIIPENLPEDPYLPESIIEIAEGGNVWDYLRKRNYKEMEGTNGHTQSKKRQKISEDVYPPPTRVPAYIGPREVPHAYTGPRKNSHWWWDGRNYIWIGPREGSTCSEDYVRSESPEPETPEPAADGWKWRFDDEDLTRMITWEDWEKRQVAKQYLATTTASETSQSDDRTSASLSEPEYSDVEVQVPIATRLQTPPQSQSPTFSRSALGYPSRIPNSPPILGEWLHIVKAEEKGRAASLPNFTKPFGERSRAQSLQSPSPSPPQPVALGSQIWHNMTGEPRARDRPPGKGDGY